MLTNQKQIVKQLVHKSIATFNIKLHQRLKDEAEHLFLIELTVAPLSAANKTRENSNLVKIWTEQNVSPHLSN